MRAVPFLRMNDIISVLDKPKKPMLLMIFHSAGYPDGWMVLIYSSFSDRDCFAGTCTVVS